MEIGGLKTRYSAQHSYTQHNPTTLGQMVSGTLGSKIFTTWPHVKDILAHSPYPNITYSCSADS